MPPKNKFTKDQLIDVAFDIANEEGFDHITIRKIAARLGCSIAPIYANFQDVEELKQAVVSKTIEVSQSMIAEQNSGDAFLDIGIASIMFAKKYPLLFDELGIKQNQYYDNNKETKVSIINQMKQDPELSGFSDKDLELLLLKMQAFQIGLSLIARNSQHSDILTDEMIIKLLCEMGTDAVNGMKLRIEQQKEN